MTSRKAVQTTSITVRVPVELRQRLEQRAREIAAATGRRVDLSKAARAVMEAGLEDAPLQDATALAELSAKLEAMRLDLSRVGGNLNQLAHAFNINGALPADSLARTHDALRTEFGQLMALLREVQRGIHRRN